MGSKNLINFRWTFNFVSCLVLTGLTFANANANAGDLEWSGMYRAEGLVLNGAALDSSYNKSTKQYGVHTLILRPKIVAADGLYINGQLNVFNSTSSTQPEVGNQLGDYFGTGLGKSTSGSKAYSSGTGESEIRVSQFYLTHVQEHGSLIVGRAPLHFGLGISHSGGRGLFDHYADTRDLVGYKMAIGNFYFFPMYAKVTEGAVGGYDDVNEMNYQLQYENPESDTTMGVFFQNRKAGAGNDVMNPAVVPSGEMNQKNFNIFYKKEAKSYTVGLEVAQQGGDLGINLGSGNVGLSGFGVALEYEYHAPESKYAFGIKTGYATGDDLSTDKEFEGFIFDRNYDIAMFLFNQSLGRADFMHTRIIGPNSSSGMSATADDHTQNSVYGRPDIEAISNVTYIAPYIKYKWSDRWSMVGSVITGMLDDSAIIYSGTTVTSTKSNLGYELDLSVMFNVSENILWTSQFGYFAPGDAWKGGSLGLGTDSMYGFITKAAVSF